MQSYWEIIERLNGAENKAQRAAIVTETGISGLPTCAASPAFSHPFFFPLDPFHLFYENCMPHIWDIWVKDSKEHELVYMRPDIASHLGAEIENAMKTLPPSFCGPIRDPYKKRQSQYKIYEWMALLHWYIVPIASELGFNSDVVKNFALFSNIIEYTMTTTSRTDENIKMLHEKIILFLGEFESLYVNDDLSKIGYCRLCIFQLIFIPHHISYNGSIRFGSQALCERMIGNIGHGVRSKKSPFQNIVSYKTDKQSLKMLQLDYPTLLSEPEVKVIKTLLFREFPITRDEKLENETLQAHLKEVECYAGLPPDHLLKIKRFGKFHLPNNITLTSQLFEESKNKTSRSSMYFEAYLEGAEALNEPLDECELEEERTKPIFGKALAFYTIADLNLSLVVYHFLMNRKKKFGRWSGQWSPDLYVLKTSAIVCLVGIWTHHDNIHILRRHPGLTLLTSDECDISDDVVLDDVQ